MTINKGYPRAQGGPPRKEEGRTSGRNVGNSLSLKVGRSHRPVIARRGPRGMRWKWLSRPYPCLTCRTTHTITTIYEYANHIALTDGPVSMSDAEPMTKQHKSFLVTAFSTHSSIPAVSILDATIDGVPTGHTLLIVHACLFHHASICICSAPISTPTPLSLFLSASPSVSCRVVPPYRFVSVHPSIPIRTSV
ncbi:hypothetical protein LX36DRAFT_356663 [Colletotrichum falcatum]|nr:hypothetical protein LX36DRAFT_356663 [Colletotrichum falcatum]